MTENLLAMWETWVTPLGREDPFRKEWLPSPLFLSEESFGQRSPVGYSPWGSQNVRHA